MTGGILWIAVALTALSLLVMLGAVSLEDAQRRWPEILFDAGAAIFGLAMAIWLLGAMSALLNEAALHGF